jgi:hypothetical protein
MQEVINGSSLGAGNSLALHFGLGTTETAAIQIIWPDGRTQSFEAVAANKQYRLGYPVDQQAEEAQRLALYGPQTTEEPVQKAVPSNLQLVVISLIFSSTVVGLVWLVRRR